MIYILHTIIYILCHIKATTNTMNIYTTDTNTNTNTTTTTTNIYLFPIKPIIQVSKIYQI